MFWGGGGGESVDVDKVREDAKLKKRHDVFFRLSHMHTSRDFLSKFRSV